MNTIYPWQQQQWQQLLTGINNNRLAHAILLSGPAGLGKLNFAQLVAARLLCENPHEYACAHCRSCHWLAVGTHPDFFQLKTEEENTSIKVDQIRELINRLTKTAQKTNYRVVIIEPAEAMNTAAANALLKTLEEPFSQTVFLLVTHQPHLLPATIRSRCQAIVFTSPNRTVAEDWLKNKLTSTSPQDITWLLNLTENMPLAALALAESNNKQLYQQTIHNFLLLTLEQKNVLAIASQCLELDINKVLTLLMLLIMDLLRMKLGAADNTLIIQDANKFDLKKIIEKTSIQKLINFFNQLLATKELLGKKINLNSQLVLENLFIEWQLNSN